MGDATTRERWAFWILIITVLLFAGIPSLVFLKKAREYRRFLTGGPPPPLKRTIVRTIPGPALTEGSLPDIQFVDFTLEAPEAEAVALAGDFNKWDPAALPLERGKNGAWSISLPLPSGTYRYAFFVDGRWRPDPRAEERTRRSGRDVSVRTVP